jgi:hypothetical protein
MCCSQAGDSPVQAGQWKNIRVPTRYGEKVRASRGGMARAARHGGEINERSRCCKRAAERKLIFSTGVDTSLGPSSKLAMLTANFEFGLLKDFK